MPGQELLWGKRGEGDGDGPGHHVFAEAGDIHGDVGGHLPLAVRGIAHPELEEVPWAKGRTCLLILRRQWVNFDFGAFIRMNLY